MKSLSLLISLIITFVVIILLFVFASDYIETSRDIEEVNSTRYNMTNNALNVVDDVSDYFIPIGLSIGGLFMLVIIIGAFKQRI